MRVLLSIFLFCFCLDADQKLRVPANVQGIFERYCTDCHGAKKKKGDVRLHDIGSLKKELQSTLLNKIEE